MTTAPATSAPAQATAAPPVTPTAPASAPAAVASPSTPQQTTATGPATSPNSATPVVGAPITPVVAVAPVADPRAEISALATQYGYDPAMLASFPDVASARAAIRFNVEQAAQIGLGGMPTPGAFVPQNPYQAAGQPQPGAYQFPAQQQQPQQVAIVQTPQGPVAIDLKALGLEEDEPAAKAIRVLEKQLAGGELSAKQLASRLDQIETANRAAAQQRVKSEATAIVDSFASPQYGSATTRTASQQVAVARLFDLADAIAIGCYNTGRPIPALNARLAQAKLIDSLDPVLAATAPALAANPAVLPQVAPQSGPTPVVAADPNAKWSQDPAIRAALNIRN